jgi:hypothetical protein
MQKMIRLFLVLASLFLEQTIVSTAQPVDWSTPRSITGVRQRARDPKAVVSSDGTIYVVWSELSYPTDDFRARLFMSIIHRDSSIQGPFAITDTGHADGLPDIALDTAGRPFVVWNDLFTGEIYYKNPIDSGLSVRTNLSQNAGDSFYPRIAIDRHNRRHVVWHDVTSGAFRIMYREGISIPWDAAISITDSLPVADFPVIAVDTADNPHIAWQSEQPPSGNIDIFYRARIGGSWTPIEQVNSDTNGSITPAISIQHGNLPVIVWQQLTDFNTIPITVKIFWSRFDGSGWVTPVAISDLIRGEKPTICVDSDDRIHVAWQNFTRSGGIPYDTVFYSTYSNGFWSPAQDISGSIGYPGSFEPVIMIIPGNRLGLVWISNDAAFNTIYNAEIFYATATLVTAVTSDTGNMPPAQFSLSQNYPNPFNSSTEIKYAILRAGFVELSIWDIQGRMVRTLISQVHAPGEYSTRVDLSGAASGVYLYVLRQSGNQAVRKLLLIR